MGKQRKLKAAAQAAKSEKAPEGLAVGCHKFRPFTGLDAALGAKLEDYPPTEKLPARHVLKPYEEVVSRIFFRGGALADFGLSIKGSIDRAQAMTAISALLRSFDPKHEHKTAVVAWCLSEWCNGTPVVD